MPLITYQMQTTSPIASSSNNMSLEDNQYVTIDAFKAMLQEVQSLKALILGQQHSMPEEHTTDDTEIQSSIDTVTNSKSDISHNNNGMVKSMYDNLPQYSGDRDIQVLLDFIDKVDNYLTIADITPMMEITYITMKLMGTASLL